MAAMKERLKNLVRCVTNEAEWAEKMEDSKEKLIGKIVVSPGYSPCVSVQGVSDCS